jgi:hypothetical protein
MQRTCHHKTEVRRGVIRPKFNRKKKKKELLPALELIVPPSSSLPLIPRPFPSPDYCHTPWGRIFAQPHVFRMYVSTHDEMEPSKALDDLHLPRGNAMPFHFRGVEFWGIRHEAGTFRKGGSDYYFL